MRRFSLSSDLRRHIQKTHIEKRPFECDVCKEGFARLRNLVAHKRKHIGSKPFQCDVCKRMFAQSSHLTTHKRTHTGNNPYSCDICKNRFSRLGSLKADFQSSHEAPRSSLRVMHEHFHPIVMLNSSF
jgi:uncharacterized Zn-finger protein